MRLELRMKYLETIYQRYHRASKRSKGRILDELCKVCKYSRKYAIWKLNRLREEEGPKVHKARHRGKKYDHKVLSIVEVVWEVANYPWSVRLKEIIRLWLPWIRKRYRVTSEMEEKLLSISPSTLDRALKSKKRKLKRRIYGRTKPGTLLRHKIPVKTDNWDVKQPGFLEADLVSHSGGSGHGEFINHHLWSYCQREGIQFTRSRPYKKDDNAHIEQKNWTHVRKFMGWDRYDSSQALKAMNDLYGNELSLFMNLFQPSVKLKKVIRKGSRKQRLYDKPQTPLDRLLASGHLDKQKREELRSFRENMDPFSLSEKVNQKLQHIWDMAHYRYNPPKGEMKINSQPEKLSPTEKETLEDIAQVFGITVYVRTHKGGKLIALGNG